MCQDECLAIPPGLRPLESDSYHYPGFQIWPAIFVGAFVVELAVQL